MQDWQAHFYSTASAQFYMLGLGQSFTSPEELMLSKLLTWGYALSFTLILMAFSGKFYR